MPLSEEELRLLEQMERALVEEDPKFASTLRGTSFQRAARRRAVLAVVAFVAGVTVLMTGAVMSLTPVGIIGFVIMLVSAYLGISAVRGSAHAGDSGATDGGGSNAESGLTLIEGGRSRRSRPRRTTSSTGFMERMEARWRRRREGGNGA